MPIVQRTTSVSLGWLGPGLALTALLLVPRSAEACGASPIPASSISSVSPASGAIGVARDAGIIVSGTSSSQFSDVLLDADVELFDADSGAAVPLVQGSWFSRSGPELRLAAHPVEPLEPLHSYRVEATTVDPDTAERSTPVVSQFVTSDAVLEPLVISGDLGLSLRAGEADVFEYGPCGGDTMIGKRRALFADVQLPIPSGGQGVYQGVLHFADHTPLRVHPRTVSDYDPNDGEHEVRLRQNFELDAGEALVLSQEVGEAEYAYAGCFTFVLWDPAGHVAQTSACLPLLSPDDIRALAQGDAAPDPASDDDVATDLVEPNDVGTDPGDTAADEPRGTPFLACSAIARRGPSSIPAWSTWLVAGLVARRLGRRRSRERS